MYYPGHYLNQSNFPIETKICQRGRGPHLENEIYCGRTLTMDHFSKGRAQCKECSVKKTQVYNANKVLHQNITQVNTNKEMEETLKKTTNELSLISNSLRGREVELEQMRNEYKKYYDSSLEYYNLTEKMKEENNKLSLLNDELTRNNKITKLELEKTKNLLLLSDNKITNLEEKNRECEEQISELNKEIKQMEDEIRILGRKR